MAKQSVLLPKAAFQENINLLSIGKGIAWAFIVTVLLFAVFALVLSYTEFPDFFISPAVFVTTVLSVVTASAVATRKIKERGWLNGSIIGIVYVILLYIAGSIAYRDFSVSPDTLLTLTAGVLSGALGGMIGINLKRKK